MKKIRVGIIGLGRIAALYEEDNRAKKYYPCLTHAGSYRRDPRIELVCGADIDRKRVRKFKDRFGVARVYTDHKKMLAENEIDILSICTYPDNHYRIIKDALPYVKVIFCEKPFTRGSGEIKKIIALQEAAGARIAIDLYRQYDVSHRKVREMLLSGRFGAIDRINCYYGKGLRNMGSHMLGYIMSVVGKPVVIRTLQKYSYKGVGEYTYDVYLEFKGKVPVVLQSCDYDNYRLFEIDMICSKGRVQILDEGLTIRHSSVRKNRAETGAFELFQVKEAASTIGSALGGAVDHLVSLKEDPGATPLFSPKEYLQLQYVIEEIERQGRRLGRV